MNVDEKIGSDFYVSTVAVYNMSRTTTANDDNQDTNLAWNFSVVMPGLTSDKDAITIGNPDFALVCGVAAFGAMICLAFLISFLANRKEKEMMIVDWRFTCLFFAGCAALICRV